MTVIGLRGAEDFMEQMSVGLKASRLQDETWRECVRRNSARYGLKEECLALFDTFTAEGMDEVRAAWNAMYEWDLGLEVI